MTEPHIVPCIECGKDACTVDECTEEGHNQSCQTIFGWVCSQPCNVIVDEDIEDYFDMQDYDYDDEDFD